jgi:hypothetical protein
MNIHQKKNMPYATDGLTDMNRLHHLQQWRSSFGIRKMPKIWIACLLMAPCLFAQGDEKHKDEKKGNSGVRHEESKPESGPIVENYKIVEHVILKDGKKGEYIMGTANVTVNPNGSWNFSGQMNPYPGETVRGLTPERPTQEICMVEGPDVELNILFALKSSEGIVIAFKHAAALGKENPQSYSWETQGNNNTIKENFKAFAKKHDWYASWIAVALPLPGSSGGGGSDAGSIIGDVVKALGPIAAVFGL